MAKREIFEIFGLLFAGMKAVCFSIRPDSNAIPSSCDSAGAFVTIPLTNMGIWSIIIYQETSRVCAVKFRQLAHKFAGMCGKIPPTRS